MESNAFTDQVGTSPCKTYLQSPLFREQSFTTTLCFWFHKLYNQENIHGTFISSKVSTV